MSNKIKHKTSGVAGHQPALTDLDVGELLFNYADGILYCKKTYQGIETIVQMHGSETPHLLKSLNTPSNPPAGYVKLFAKGDLLFAINSAGVTIELGPGNHTHDNLYLRLDGGQMLTTEIIRDLNANFLEGYSAADFALANHTHSSQSALFSKIELSNSPAQISVNTWTAIPGISLGITEAGNYQIMALVGLQRSSTAGYCAARIKLGSTIIASAEAYGSYRQSFHLSTIRQVSVESIVIVEIWSSISGTSAIASTPSSLSGSTTILLFSKI